MNNPIKKLSDKRNNQGVLLIICLILLVVLSGLGLAVVSTAVTTNKASKYSNAKLEAQQKADVIANYALAQVMNWNHQVDLTTCTVTNFTKACGQLTAGGQSTNGQWNGQVCSGAAPAAAYLAKSDTTTKVWWRTNAQDYPLAATLQSFPTYTTSTGAQITDPVASYFITQEQAASTDSDGYNLRTLRIVAYATDATGQTAAIRQMFYTFIANCKATVPARCR